MPVLRYAHGGLKNPTFEINLKTPSIIRPAFLLLLLTN